MMRDNWQYALVKLGLFAGLAMGSSASGAQVAVHEHEVVPGQTAAVKEKAPETQWTQFYHLVFVVKEIDGGKVINSRSYSIDAGVSGKPTLIYNPNQKSIRAGTKVPVESEGAGKVNYTDVGVSIDLRQLEENEGKLAMVLSAEVSSLAESSSVVRGLPSILQNKWSSDVRVPLGKPTVVFSSDEVTSKRTMVMEMTATRMQ